MRKSLWISALLLVTLLVGCENTPENVKKSSKEYISNQGVAQMREYLLALAKQGKCILLSSHSKEDINLLCDVVYYMEHGRITKTTENPSIAGESIRE